MKHKNLESTVIRMAVIMVLAGLAACGNEKQPPGSQLFDLGTGLVSRSISFENPTGAAGETGGRTNNASAPASSAILL